jgi:hypothetical protein
MCVSAGLGKEGVPIRPRRVNPTDRHRDPSEAARSPCSFMDKTATKAEASPTKSEVPDQGVNPFFLFDLPSLRYFRFSLKKKSLDYPRLLRMLSLVQQFTLCRRQR